MSQISNPSAFPRRPRYRLVAVIALLLTLAGCGRGLEAAAVHDRARDLTTTTTDARATTSTTTTVAAVVESTTTVPVAVTVAPVAKPSTTVPPTTVPLTTRLAPVTVEVAPQPVASTSLQPATVTSHGGPVRDHVSLVDNLRGRGLTVMPVSSISQPFLHADGTSLAISGPGVTGTQLQSYDYATNEAAAADAATIGPDGNPRGTMVSWVSAPHFYLRGRALVIYVGTDPAVTSLLADLVGPQFAGR